MLILAGIKPARSKKLKGDNMNRYDLAIIGSGPAGHTAALKAARLGSKVALIEKDMSMLGGVCLNEGCIPAKSLLHSAKMLDMLNAESVLFGVERSAVKPDIAGFVAKSRRAAEGLGKGLQFILKKNEIDLINAEAFLKDRNTVALYMEGEEEELQADRVLVATGSRPKEIPSLAFDGDRVISSSEAIRLEEAPGNLLIVGAGAIGTEFASYFSSIGSRVTLIEMEPNILPFEDIELTRRLKAYFKQKGVEVRTSCSSSDVGLDSFDKVIVSIGRTPSVRGLGLEELGVVINEKGFIEVDDRLRTSVDNIHAAGDVVPTPMLAHSASAEGELAAEIASGKDSDPIDYECVPNVVYTHIELASVGLTEDEARASNTEYSAGKSFYKANGRAVVHDESEGFIKVLADKRTRRIIGAHILGHHASELIHEFVVAKKNGLTVEDIADTVHAHPTFSEAAMEVCKTIF